MRGQCPTFAEQIFHREAISSTAGGLIPPTADFIEKALAIASAFSAVADQNRTSAQGCLGSLIGKGILRLVCIKILWIFCRQFLSTPRYETTNHTAWVWFVVWRTMADSNRRHQASEACALSIWANGAYCFLRLLVYHIFLSNASLFFKNSLRLVKTLCRTVGSFWILSQSVLAF